THLTKEHIISELEKIREILIYQHNGLFLPLVENLLNKVYVFGLHFASLDIRQDSMEHAKVLEVISAVNKTFSNDYEALSEKDKITQLLSITEAVNMNDFDDELVKDTIH